MCCITGWPTRAEVLAFAAEADRRVLDALCRADLERPGHPLLPFVDWDGCRPALGRLGHVIIAGARDHGAARQLGFVPTHGVGAALTMARGWTERPPRVGFLLSPPYFPLRVGSS